MQWSGQGGVSRGEGGKQTIRSLDQGAVIVLVI